MCVHCCCCFKYEGHREQGAVGDFFFFIVNTRSASVLEAASHLVVRSS